MPETSRLRYHQLWLVIGISIIIGIIYFSLTSSGIPAVGKNINDKVLHTLGYFVLMLWFCQIYFRRLHRLILMTVFIFMGIGLEFLQGYGGVRHYEIADMFANSAGVLIGWLAATKGLDGMLAWFENLGRQVD